jgi:AraC-like DNA-binding protein
MRIRRNLILICLFLCSLLSFSAKQEYRLKCYDQWSKLSSAKLMDMGCNYANILMKPDSALVCFSVVANRYYESNLNNDDLLRSIQATENISILYMYVFFDFTKAYSFSVRALEMSKKANLTQFLPNIYLSMAVLQNFQSNMISPNNAFNLNVLKSYKKAFYAGLKTRNWNVVEASFFDMMIETTFKHKANLMKNEMKIIKHDVPDSVRWVRYARCLVDGVTSFDGGNKRMALFYFKKFLFLTSKYTLPHERPAAEIVARDYLYTYYMDAKQYDEALQQLLINMKSAKANNKILHLLEIYNNMYNFYLIRHDSANATKYRMLYLEEKDNLVINKRLGYAGEAKFLYEIQKKNEKVMELSYKRKVQGWILSGISVFAVVLSVVLVMLYIKYRQVSQRNKQLYQKTLDLLKASEEKRLLIDKIGQLPVTSQQCSNINSKYENSPMDDNYKSDLLNSILIVMETSDEIYSEKFSLERLAEMVKTKRNYVSQVINEKYDNNFNHLLNEYRIKESCRRMNDTDNYGNYTIESIALSVGFKSRSNFISTFKRFTGLTPSAYLKIAKNNG